MAMFPPEISVGGGSDYILPGFSSLRCGPFLYRDTTKDWDGVTDLTSFTGTDENPLSEGGNWAKIDTNDPAFRRVSSAVQCQASNINAHSAYWTPKQFGPDCSAEIGCTQTPSSTPGGFGVGARLTGVAGVGTVDGYMVRYTNGPDPDEIQICVFTNLSGFLTSESGVTVLASMPMPSGWPTNARLGITCKGTRISAYKYQGGVRTELLFVHDSTYTGAGYVGFWGRLSSTSDTIILDDFAAGEHDKQVFAMLGIKGVTNQGDPRVFKWSSYSPTSFTAGSTTGAPAVNGTDCQWSCARLGDKIWVAGWTSTTQFNLWSYDMATNTWATASGGPISPTGLVNITKDARIYIGARNNTDLVIVAQAAERVMGTWYSKVVAYVYTPGSSSWSSEIQIGPWGTEQAVVQAGCGAWASSTRALCLYTVASNYLWGMALTGTTASTETQLTSASTLLQWGPCAGFSDGGTNYWGMVIRDNAIKVLRVTDASPPSGATTFQTSPRTDYTGPFYKDSASDRCHILTGYTNSSVSVLWSRQDVDGAAGASWNPERYAVDPVSGNYQPAVFGWDDLDAQGWGVMYDNSASPTEVFYRRVPHEGSPPPRLPRPLLRM